MNINEIIDTPRIYTAFAEWFACFLYIIIIEKSKVKKPKYILRIVCSLLLFIVFHFIAGILPIYFWVVGMCTAVALIYFSIKFSCNIPVLDAWFLALRAFVLAEFVASLGWQLYVWSVLVIRESTAFAVTLMLLSTVLIFGLYFMLEKKQILSKNNLQVSLKDLFSTVLIALSCFTISNLSFFMPNTPFSTSSFSILYVRTLVDFAGLIMLYSQQNKREEFRIKSENQAVNALFARQYEQYKLAQSNIEMLKREFHDLKHFMLAIRTETDITAREHYIKELAQSIAVQEALMDTGNKVLNVVLSSKMIYCVQNKITFTCMANGELLSFMDVKDICSIFGNAIDNAIECVEKYNDNEKKLINLNIIEKDNFISIQVENYLEKDLNVKSGIPKTTKSDKTLHGYGLKSIKAIAEKYSGFMSITAQDNTFTLQILLPKVQNSDN